jgi:hypothetical protein
MNKTSVGSLVANLLEVLAQLGDRVEGVGGLDVSRVVSDEERLGRLVGDDALLALLGLERVVAGLDGHVLFAVDLDAVGDDALGLALVVERSSDGAHLGGGEREAWRRGPGSLAGGIADDGFVDVAGADEALINVCLPGHDCGECVVEEGVVDVDVEGLMLVGRRKERSGAEVLLGMYAVSKGRGQWAGSGRAVGGC